ncbi:MAG: helix-turn-helix domain-containing protein [Yoonia sp.]|nr:helix-turn-helix domain-containing protein [Yoonia sp.]
MLYSESFGSRILRLDAWAWNDSARAKVHQLKADGYSTYKIAEEMDISRMSVHRILNTETA